MSIAERKTQMQENASRDAQGDKGRSVWLFGTEVEIEHHIDVLIAEARAQLEPGRPFEIRITRGDRSHSESRHAVSWYSSAEMARNAESFPLMERMPAVTAPKHLQIDQVYVVARLANPIPQSGQHPVVNPQAENPAGTPAEPMEQGQSAPQSEAAPASGVPAPGAAAADL